MDRSRFEREIDEQGYGEPRVVSYEPGSGRELHTHPFSARLLVLRGEFLLKTEHGVQSFAAGSVCSVEAGMAHTEGAGADGATVLLAKRS